MSAKRESLFFRQRAVAGLVDVASIKERLGDVSHHGIVTAGHDNRSKAKLPACRPNVAVQAT